MAGTLLETKLRVPRLRRGLTARPRLSERLNRGAESTLTLVSAPAGFGKTTLMTEWLASVCGDGRSAAWLSLDKRDNDPALFWTYFVTALKRVSGGVGAAALSLLQSAQPPIDAVLATLLNDLHTVSNDVVLVLDDFHVIDAREIQEGIVFLLEHLPPQVHLVIACRADPMLPLARLRARGELVEIRAADLRFTADEAADYLNGVMGMALTAGDVAILEGRTEGWIAALQLAALSMQGREDVAGFIAGFAGHDRYIVDYLVEEVLQRQPENVQQFLLQTSVLDRLTGPLCDAVTGQDSGKVSLVALERGNLFLVPLDERRQWYRYHQLFVDVLQARLLDEHGEEVQGLHRRASAWYEQNGEGHDAIRHALAAKDFGRAADLVELAIPAIRRNRQEAVLRSWLTLLPDDVVRVRPVLGVGLVGALVVSGDVEGVESRLREAERWLKSSTDVSDIQAGSTEMVVVDDEEFRRLPETIEVYRAALALGRGDGPGTVSHARRALDLAPEEDHLSRAAASGLLGLAYWGRGELQAAHRAYAECMAGLQRAGHLADTFGCAIALGDIRIAQGHLNDAMRTYERALGLVPGQRGSVLRGTADMHVGMSGVCRERGDLQGATRLLLRSQELGPLSELPQNLYRWRVAMARILEAEGDLAGALDLLAEAERLYVGDYFPNIRPVPAFRARIQVAQGRLGEALGWVRERGLSAEDDLSYLREFEHITLARVLLARYTKERSAPSLQEAIRLLGRLLRAAEDGGRTGSAIEILVLQALADQMRGDIPAALVSLHRAVAMSEPEGYVRIFAEEGEPMVSLLKAAVKQRVAPSYLRRLIADMNNAEDSAPVNRGMIEPLSERELDVLRLLGTDLDGPDIARVLMVSLNTVRTHTSHIYAKLGVNNRRAAVRQAQELDLFSRASDG
ncbi:LuxR C-terminal-related transcriptional regulator [Arthrobacter sp. ISL-30]|uniref:LuxR C-terminal-related transcriptional regulator n=1 Tax=Arthrobacter sp. ISL-30 TaxID=2819109 RepID=UPI001BE8D46C|nr:LuxR C-terminal-related transcriptional regulator [Arthrobacter sp. ISL-30]MBT2514575.1 AAA family ATPase [Arthrobacter sp. ISL-30]